MTNGGAFAEVLRIKGELLHRQGKFKDADTAFATARGWAERQGALSLSLRNATGAARLWQDMGRAAAARAELTAVWAALPRGSAPPTIEMPAPSLMV